MTSSGDVMMLFSVVVLRSSISKKPKGVGGREGSVDGCEGCRPGSERGQTRKVDTIDS